MNILKKQILGLFMAIFLISILIPISGNSHETLSDLDPLVDVSVTVEIKKIRSLEKFDAQIPSLEKIDMTSAPDFYV